MSLSFIMKVKILVLIKWAYRWTHDYVDYKYEISNNNFINDY